MSELTPAEAETIRVSVTEALNRVTHADADGIYETFKEERAAARAFKDLPPHLRGILISRRAVGPTPTGDEHVTTTSEASIADLLGAAKAAVAARHPDDLDAFCAAVIAAAEASADAVDGTSEAEQAVIDQIRDALA